MLAPEMRIRIAHLPAYLTIGKLTITLTYR
jgi:hypothetical protein